MYSMSELQILVSIKEGMYYKEVLYTLMLLYL